MAKKIRMMKEHDGLGIKIPDLARQKQILKKSYLDFLGAGIFIFALTILVFVVGLLVEDSAHSKRIVFIAVPILLWITIVFAFFFLRRLSLFGKFNKITTASEESKRITCCKVGFLSKARSRASSVIICLIFTDENGEKYYAVTEDIWGDSKKAIRAEYVGAELSLVCYKDTNFVKDYAKRQ